jgi:hypothetical protein
LLALNHATLSAMELLAPYCLLLLLRIIRDTTLVSAAASTTVLVTIGQAASVAPSRNTAGKLRTTTAAGG